MAYAGASSYRGPLPATSVNHALLAGGLHYPASVMHPANAATFASSIMVGSVGYSMEHSGPLGPVSSRPPQIVRKLNNVSSITNLRPNASGNSQCLDYQSQPSACMAGPPSSLTPAGPVNPIGHGSISVAAPSVLTPNTNLVSDSNLPNKGLGIDTTLSQSAPVTSTQTVPQNSTGTNVPDDMQTLQSEIENLRRSVAAQEDRIAQLKQELDTSRENETHHKAEAEAIRHELVRVGEELRQERERREQAEMAVAAVMSTPPASAGTKPVAARGQAKSKVRSISSGNLRPNPSMLECVASGSTSEVTLSARPVGEHASNGRREKVVPGSSVSAPRSSSKGMRMSALAPQKDDIDVRLNEYFERSETGLTFCRLNRGWYSFRRADNRSPPSGDRGVEISIVNGKLMARLEPTTHEKGWNNGKLGPIERFCSHFAHFDAE